MKFALIDTYLIVGFLLQGCLSMKGYCRSTGFVSRLVGRPNFGVHRSFLCTSAKAESNHPKVAAKKPHEVGKGNAKSVQSVITPRLVDYSAW